ncbi:hypothetical protein BDV29DRAFT_186610 [Aspergillus leporis]|uniref:Uncharacterized protein n=1 Tax=Aspergillus leporis TaxID=41062 RepID=A0A5N5WFY6_9EURO|nr:hypothetical protein BDV29DRAFT_186610 [Aspergillus leporis]
MKLDGEKFKNYALQLSSVSRTLQNEMHFRFIVVSCGHLSTKPPVERCGQIHASLL